MLIHYKKQIELKNLYILFCYVEAANIILYDNYSQMPSSEWLFVFVLHCGEFFMSHLWALCLLVCGSVRPFVRPFVPHQVKVFGRGSFLRS